MDRSGFTFLMGAGFGFIEEETLDCPFCGALLRMEDLEIECGFMVCPECGGPIAE